MKNDKKYFIIGIIAIIFVIAVPLVTYIINLDDNKENKNDITTTTTKKNEYNDLVITNETLLQDCVNSTCKEIKIGNIKLQVKNYKLYLNGEVLFPESGSMEYDDQLYYEIKYMDDDNLFFNVTFAGEYSHQYIYGKDGKESIDIRSLSNFEYVYANYENGYLTISGTDQSLIDIFYNVDSYCTKIDTFDDIKIVKTEDKYKYLGNAKLGEKEAIKQQTIKTAVFEACTLMN